MVMMMMMMIMIMLTMMMMMMTMVIICSSVSPLSSDRIPPRLPPMPSLQASLHHHHHHHHLHHHHYEDGHGDYDISDDCYDEITMMVMMISAETQALSTDYSAPDLLIEIILLIIIFFFS